MFLERVEQGTREPEVPAHELAGVLRPVHPREVEHEVCLRTPTVQFLWRGIKVVFIHLRDGDAIVAGLSVFDVLQLHAEVSAYEAFGAGNEYSHTVTINHLYYVQPLYDQLSYIAAFERKE